jgi:hypothetical protein
MSNDKAQELTKTINDSIATLCAETDLQGMAQHS